MMRTAATLGRCLRPRRVVVRAYSGASIPRIPPQKPVLPPSDFGCPSDLPPPARYGSYAVLNKAMAMETYPPPRDVPTSIARPGYVPVNFFTAPIWEHAEAEDKTKEGTISLGTEEERGVREAARVAAETLKMAGALVRPGITTDEIDEAVHEFVVSKGAYPSPLGYSRFPRSCTTSVNNVIAHGIPDDRPLRADDIINIDITIYLNGYHGDTSATFALPETDAAGLDLVEATRQALRIGIKQCGPGKPYAGIGQAIDKFTQSHGLSVNMQLAGHGIGRRFHQSPNILHHSELTFSAGLTSENWEKGIMQPGDCFTIEPPLVQGPNSRGTVWEDGWTVGTDTGARSAQFEHQILITETGADVITELP